MKLGEGLPKMGGVGDIFGLSQSKMKPITTKENPDGNKEFIGVEIGFGPKNLDKLNMDGASPVKTVKRR
jgi:hypothetical protein